MAKWCLDPGHGGVDSGAVGMSGRYEKDVVLEAALRARAILESNGQTVIMTRTRDVFVSLKGRTQYANSSGCDYFVSIHMNSAVSSSAIGTEVWISKGSSSTSVSLANIVVQYMYSGINNNFGYNTPNRGVKSENFWVIRYTSMPACLIEGDFINNPIVESNFNAIKYGEFIANGCLSFIGSSSSVTPPESVNLPSGGNGNSSSNNIKITNLSPNSYSTWVVKLQKELNKQGFRDAYGRLLSVDGFVGPNTLAACNKTPIYYGTSGNITRLLQEILVSLGYNVNGIDGNCGYGMVSGIKKYQSDWGLSVDGSFGPQSWKAILGL